MNNKTCRLLFCFLFLALLNEAKGQQFELAELNLVKPSMILPENYTVLPLPAMWSNEAIPNRYDANNPYSYLQDVVDSRGNHFHILIQTDLWGKLTYLGYSNGLAAIFMKREKPMFLFNRCIKDISAHMSPLQVQQAVLKCVLSRLDYCSDY